jgi:hypothetical protein
MVMMRSQARLELAWKARPAAVADARRAVTAFVERACPGIRD